ncbi:YgaP family membrane protein [Fibrella aquatica]|uniref:YgaP family membrane protein n=1 Tax=Fibrella aquatica TaxID=3242487 RepID=UPI003521F5FF
MKKNMGSIDRTLRIVIAIVLIVLYATGTLSGVWGIVSLAVAGIFLLTSLVSTCPLYLPFGIRTR